MSLLKIARLGHPVLRHPASPVADAMAPGIQKLANDMVETLIDARGVGLAAPQVHESLRVIVVTLPPDNDGAPSGDYHHLVGGQVPAGRRAVGGRVPVVLINPVLTPLDPFTDGGYEGCLSIPGLRGSVPRYPRVAVEAQDGAGQPVQFEADGYEARILQHEVDHLDGILYLDRMVDMRSLAFDTEMHHLLNVPHRDRGTS